jgi:hypothetical protein
MTKLPNYPIVGMYMVPDYQEPEPYPEITTSGDEFTWADDLNVYAYEKLEPFTKVTITFDDGECVDGVFICEELNRCYVVTDPSLPHPPGWYPKRQQVSIRK